jgi:2-methylcitrate dehydratase PrpD
MEKKSVSSTQALLAITRRIDAASLPDDVLTVAKHCVLDWLGVTLAGAREPASQIVHNLARAERGDEVTLLGFGARSSLLTAALVHGTASHALDYDDTHWGLQGHPTAPVLSAIWGLAARERVSGRSFLSALVTGVEVECQLGRWLNPPHYARGFHATGTLGTFGAAAAAAQLLRLDEHALRHAFGLAGTEAAGLKSAFGSMAKPLHVGRAAQAGLMAALLAQAGFTACPDILDDPQGFAATHGAPAQPLSAAASTDYEICHTLFKYHAACHLTHASMEALRQLCFELDEVERVELSVDETCLSVCAIERPANGLQAKFSLKATAALTLLGAATEDPRTFSDQLATAPELAALMARVHVGVKPMPATRTELVVRLRDGRALEAAFDSGVPERNLVLQGQRLSSKFHSVAPLTAARSSELCKFVAGLEHVSDVGAQLQTLVNGALC